MTSQHTYPPPCQRTALRKNRHLFLRSNSRTTLSPPANLLWGKEDANALLMEVFTHWGKHHVLAAHTPEINIGCEPYV